MIKTEGELDTMRIWEEVARKWNWMHKYSGSYEYPYKLETPTLRHYFKMVRVSEELFYAIEHSKHKMGWGI